ncbi:MAG TPA: glycosyltransferase family 1 protein [Verrucomicrobiae bacterium]|nr:glycosyltransferase family 1 protein [Verrucomicrobiae bacterium]
MHIGISSLMIQRGKTGVAQYLFALLRQLQARPAAHRFTVFVLEEDVPLFDFIRGGMHLVTVPERFRPAVHNIFWHQKYLPTLARELGLDVLHIPSYRRLLGRRPCPLVATIHDLAPFRVPGKYDWKRMFYGRVVVRWLARHQDRIIAVSQNTARDIVTFFQVPEQRIQVVHNGLEHERFYPGSARNAKAWARNRFQLERPFFLYIARLEHPGKNHLRLISAFERFKQASGCDWQLVLAGSDWHGAEVIHAAIKRSAERKQIKCLGFVAQSELPELYRAADAFVYPSLFEGFGMPPIEAMACGCPVISSTAGSLAEVIGEAALKVDPESVTAMADQMSRLTLDEGMAERLRAAGLVQARKFDWARTASETLQVYQQAATSGGSRLPLTTRGRPKVGDPAGEYISETL